MEIVTVFISVSLAKNNQSRGAEKIVFVRKTKSKKNRPLLK